MDTGNGKNNQKLSPKRKITLIIAGLFVGFLNGFFGGGGGMLVVPALTLIGCLEEKKAHATAIAVILPLSIASGIVYLLKAQMDYSMLGVISIGVVAGGVLGSFLLKKLNNKFLTMFFYIVMLVAGISMLCR